MMFRQRERRKVPGLNTTSTADISFMLLILFLVASSMDLDKGIARQLPPMEKEQKQQTAVDGRKVIRLAIDANNKVTMDGKNVSMKDIRQRTEQFVNANGKSHPYSYRPIVKHLMIPICMFRMHLLQLIMPLETVKHPTFLVNLLTFAVLNSNNRLLMRYLFEYQKSMPYQQINQQQRRKEGQNEFLSWT